MSKKTGYRPASDERLIPLKEDEFRDLLLVQQELRDLISATKHPSSELHHYTNAAGLIGITGEKKAIFASEIHALNDLAETRELEKVAGDLQDRIAGLKNASSNFRNAAVRDVFVACFCADGNLMPMWRGYAGAGSGYSIGFKADRLQQTVEGCFLLPVRYGPMAHEKALRRLFTKFDSLEERRTTGKLVIAQWALTFAMAETIHLLEISCKHEDFAYECESRLVYTRTRMIGKPKFSIEFRERSGIIIPYVEISLPRTSDGKLDAVVVHCGPSLNDRMTKQMVERMLYERGLDIPVIDPDVHTRY